MESTEKQLSFLIPVPSSPDGTTLEDSLEQYDSTDQPQSLYALSLKEYAPLTDILTAIPAQAQRGLSKFDIEFTCLDAHPNWIAIGSNVGTLFLYHRQTGELTRLRHQDYIGSITCVRFYSVGEVMVAFGTQAGAVLAYQVPDAKGANKQLECFTVSGYHSAPVTCLAWSLNGMLLFSADASGLVVSTSVDYFEHWSSSRVLLQESAGVVQLFYHPLALLVVSTLQRCILCHVQSEETFRIVQIGQKGRKVHGTFGGTFDPISLSTDDPKVCTARPGLRLWKANLEGVVTETLLMKSSCLLARQQASIQVLNSGIIKDVSMPADGEQFGLLYVFQGLFILTWNKVALYVLDPEMRGVVASTGLGDLTNIVDVATCTDEIFVLQGKRNIRRLATSPEEEFNLNLSRRKGSDASQLLSSILSPFQGMVKDRSASNVFEWFKLKPDTSKTVVQEPMAEMATLPLLPPVVTLSEKSLEIGLELQEIPKQNNPPEEIAPIRQPENRALIQNSVLEQKTEVTHPDPTECSDQEMTDSPVVVYKVKKGRKKRNKAKMAIREVVQVEKEVIPLELPPLECPRMELPHLPTNPISISPSHDEDDLLARILGNYQTNNNNTDDDVNSNRNEVTTKENESPVDENSSTLIERKSSSPSDDSKSTNSIELDSASSTVANENGTTSNEEPCSPDVDIYNSPPMHEPFRREPNVCKLEMQSSPKTHTEEGLFEEPSGDDWVQYRGPSGRIISLTVSSRCLYVVDSNEILFYSNLKGPGLDWSRVAQSARQVSVSPSGSFLWALHKSTIYAVAVSPLSGAPKSKWTEAARDVTQVAVDDNCAWYLKLDGELRLQKGLSAERPCFKSQKVSCPVGPVSQLSCRAGVLWILTQQNKLYCCSLPALLANTPSAHLQVSWREIHIRVPMCLSTISLGGNGSGWFVNDQGHMWLKEGINVERPQGEDASWQVSMDVVPAMEKEWKPFSSLAETPQLLLVAGTRGLWIGLQSLLWASRGNLIGHKWDNMSRNPNWTHIATLGSNLGVLWMLTRTGELQCLHSLHARPTHIPLLPVDPRAVGQVVCMSPSVSSLWVLRGSGSVLARVGVSPPAIPQGTSWKTVDLSQLGDCKLVHLSCGENAIWACDDTGCIWARIGPLSPGKGGLEPAWIPPDDDRSAKYSKVYVSGDGQIVWALDSHQRVYAREGVSSGYPIGRKWIAVPGMQAVALALSNRAVYALSNSGTVHRRSGIDHALYPAGICWNQLPGIEHCLSISVTAGDELWALNKAGFLLQHVATRVQHQTEGSVHRHPVLLHLNAENTPDEGWEVI